MSLSTFIRIRWLRVNGEISRISSENNNPTFILQNISRRARGGAECAEKKIAGNII